MAKLDDHYILQKDIDYLLDWAIRNKMTFHPSKCKVLSVSSFRPPLVDVLPGIQIYYSMGNENVLLDYVDSEKDLGILMNPTLKFNEQVEALYSKANQKLGLLKRTAYFITEVNKKRALYLTLVRSIFEHCPIVWRPASNAAVNKLESLQKRALKWIRGDNCVSYSSGHLYHIHCKQLNILPIRYRFDYHDLKFFHSVIYKYSCTKLPEYLTFFDGSSRLRSTHLDHLSLISSVKPRVFSESGSRRGFSNTYFYRTHHLWNRLPLSLREIIGPGQFKSKMLDHIWKEFVPVFESSLTESELDISNSED